MAQKLSDADVADLRALAGEGVAAAELAERFEVSRRHVGRLLRGEQRQQVAGLDREVARSSVAVAVERFVADLELDAAGEVCAEAAFVLAAKLDAPRASDAAAAAGAAPALARQLVEVVHALRPDCEEPDALDDLRRRREARVLAAHRDFEDNKQKEHANARSTLLEGAEALERRRTEFACVRGIVSWLDGVAQGGTPSAEARSGLGRGRLAPTFNPAGYCSQIPRANRRNPDDGFGFEEVVAGLRELADPPAPTKPPELRPVTRAA